MLFALAALSQILWMSRISLFCNCNFLKIVLWDDQPAPFSPRHLLFLCSDPREASRRCREGRRLRAKLESLCKSGGWSFLGDDLDSSAFMQGFFFRESKSNQHSGQMKFCWNEAWSLHSSTLWYADKLLVVKCCKLSSDVISHDPRAPRKTLYCKDDKVHFFIPAGSICM